MSLEDFLSIYPIAAAAVTGFLAIAVTFNTPKTVISRNIWLTIFAILAITGVGAAIWQQSIHNDQERVRITNEAKKEKQQTARENKKDKEDAYKEGQMSNIISMLSKSPTKEDAIRQSALLREIENDITKLKKSDTVSGKEKPSLKARTLQLAKQIIKFVSERDKNMTPQPILNTREAFEAYSNKISNYVTETMYLYASQFKEEALEIRNELLPYEAYDPRLDRPISYPVTTFDIRETAQRLADIAEKIP